MRTHSQSPSLDYETYFQSLSYEYSFVNTGSVDSILGVITIHKEVEFHKISNRPSSSIPIQSAQATRLGCSQLFGN